MKSRLLVLFIGSVTALLLLEGGLRVFGAFFPQRGARRVPGDDGVRIMCLGDSYTYGLGASPDHSYPAQLEALLRRRYPEKRVTVFNVGFPGRNSTVIRARFADKVEEIAPQMVILLAGVANLWDLTGYGNRSRPGWRRALAPLYSLKTVRLVMHLCHGRATGGAGGGWLKAFRRDGRVAMRHAQEGWRHKERGDVDLAIDSFGKAIREDPRNAAYYWMMGTMYEDIGDGAAAVRWMREGIRVNRSESSNYYGIGWSHFRRHEYRDAFVWFRRGIEADPNDPRNMNYTGIVLNAVMGDGALFDDTSSYLMGLSGRRQVGHAVLEDIRSMFRGDGREQMDRRISDWVAADIREICGSCERRGIRVLLQNYPVDIVTNAVLAEVAGRLEHVPFVDQRSVFIEELRSRQADEIFVPDGHCNAQGYGIMARTLYDRIVSDDLLRGGPGTGGR